MKLDPSVSVMLRRMQDEFNAEIAGNRSGPIANAVLPLNNVLVQRQKRIEDLTRQRDMMARWMSEALLKLESGDDGDDEVTMWTFLERGKHMVGWVTTPS